ncbi:venom protease [Drosophila sulfurigaster albostrigata]|uniref:venom protease n=1 Tax=Drosophila sulfurigaster albostrigata TaxID=89887 RepID=UPI002D21AC7B|nr:venom protease [Drosophila sulfurigaster albostrigata]
MMKCLQLSFVLLLSFSWQLVLSKSYSNEHIDLLDLSDNDEFQWGADENKLYSQANDNNDSNIDGISNFLSRHRLNKRQAPSDSPLLENKDYGACRTPLGDVGRCRHIIYCRMPELKNDVWRLVSQLCIIEKSAIGICCTDQATNSRFSPQIVSGSDAETPRIINRQPEQRGCGITTRQFPRITGGRPAEADEWPWMAALLREGFSFVWCGGVLITDRHVLTAAHCLENIKKDQLFVRLGEYNTHQLNETRARDFRIASMVLHVDYDTHNYMNDIAMIRIERPTLFNTYIWPVCMPPLNEDWSGRNAIVMGWGTQKFNGAHSKVLMEANLPVWKQSDCQAAMVEHIPSTVICAGLPEGGQDSCQGDSGGPLVVQLPNMRWVTIGIVSWGLGCAQAGRPGVYTRVDRYLDWIISNADI